MGPTWLMLNTSEGKARGPEPWPLNSLTVYLSLYKGGVPGGFNTRTKPYVQPCWAHMAQSQQGNVSN